MDDVTRKLREQVLQRAAAMPAPTRAAESRRQWFFLAVALACTLFVAFKNGAPVLSAARPAGYVLVAGGGALLVALLGGAWLLRRSMRGLGAFGTALPGFAAAVMVAVLGAAFGAYVFVPWDRAAEIWGAPSHVPCLVTYGSLTLSILILGLRAFRGSEPVMPALRGVALAAVAVAMGTFAMAFHCPRVELLHVLLSHVGPAPVVLLLGAVLGSWVLRVRSAP